MNLNDNFNQLKAMKNRFLDWKMAVSVLKS